MKVFNIIDDPYYKKIKDDNKPNYGKLTPNVSIFNQDYIPYGKDNKAPNYFAELNRSNVAHRSILNSKVLYTKGSGIVADNEDLLNLIKENNLQENISRFLLDEYGLGSSYIEVVTNSTKDFVYLYHLENTKCRLNKDLTGIILNPDWTRRNKENDINISFYPEFTEREDGLMHSVIWKPNYEPEFINGIPSWYAGLRSVKISGLTNEINEKQLENGYFKDAILLAPLESADDQKKLQDKMNKVDSGAENAGGVIVAGMPTGADSEKIPKPELIDLRMDLKGAFMDLHTNSRDELILIHNWFRALLSMPDNTGFDTQKILNEYKIALSSSIVPKQNEYIDIFNMVYSDFGYNTEGLAFVNEAPLNPVKDKVNNIKEFFDGIGVEFNPLDPQHITIIKELL